MRNRRRSLALAFLSLCLLAGLAVWLWPAPPAPPPPPPRARGASAPVSVPRLPPPPPQRQKTPDEVLVELDQRMRDPEVMEEYLRKYREANRYPDTTLMLVPGMTDVLEPFHFPARDMPQLTVRNLFTKPEYRVNYRFETDRFRYVAPQPVQLRFTLWRGEKDRQPVSGARVAPVAALRLHPNGNTTRLGTISLTETEPGTWTGTWTPPKIRGAQHDDVIQFDLEWQVTDAKLKPGRDRALIQYTLFPPASFTGRFHERLVNGSLHVDAEVESQRAGEVQVAGNLFTAEGTPVSTSIVNSRVEAGRSWVTLEFYGRVFHDRNAAGPYVLKTLRGHFPSTGVSGRGAEFIPWPHDYRTKPYRLSDFTHDEWDSPRKRAGIAAYEQEIARLRR